MPANPRRNLADPNLIKPGDIVWLDAKHLTPTRGPGTHSWPHNAICLYHYYQNTALPDLIVSGTIFQFVCISSITARNPFDPTKQVRLDHTDRNLGLTGSSAACVDFAPSVVVTVEGQRHVLEGVRRLIEPVVHRVPASPTLQAIGVLFHQYWSAAARPESHSPEVPELGKNPETDGMGIEF
jgi:hypothetical protein